MKRLLLITLAFVLTLTGINPVPSQAQEENPIRILSEEVENNFPQEAIFHIDVESQAADIKRIKVVYKMRGAVSLTKNPLEFEPAQRVQASYRWFTGSTSIPPGAPVLYHWEITDKAGNTLTTEDQVFYYDDVRFDWDTLEDDDLTVFWYEGGAEFGQQLYDTASIALRELKDSLGAELDFSIRIVVYGSAEDFRSAFPYVNEWVGGRAFPSRGLTVQIIAPWDYGYMIDVLPHEISHLLVFQLTDNPFVGVPRWLDEGLAVHNEWADNSYYDDLVEEAAAIGQLLPMEFITDSWPNRQEHVSLAYAQSYSLVRTLLAQYGWPPMTDYLSAFKGASLYFDRDVAFEEAFGLPFEEFLADWRLSVGATSTPTPVPAEPPTAAPAEPTPQRDTPLPESTPLSDLPSASPPPTDEPTPTGKPSSSPSPWPCLGGAVLLAPVVLLWRRRRQEAA